MKFLYVFLTVLMFMDCVVLVFLVLLQLPKKEAGAGMAFGGAATDALFGAGSGNMLTKITKYAAGIFFGMAILLAFMASQKPESDAASLAQKLAQGGVAPLAAPATQPAASATAPTGGGFLNLSNAAPMPPAGAQTAPAPAPAPTTKTNK
jgi:preprotein translocase subunit SecG